MRLRRRNFAPRPLEPDEPGVLDRAPAWVVAGVSSLGAAATSAALVLGLLFVAWLVTPVSSASGSQVVELGLGGWLLAHGARLHAGSAVVSMTPWLLSLLPFVTLRWAAQRSVAALPAEREPTRVLGGVRRDVALSGAAFIGSYVVLAGLLALLARFDGFFVGFPSAVLGALVFALLSYLLALRALAGEEAAIAPEASERVRARVPAWLRRSVSPALLGVVALLALGAVAVLVVVGLSFARVSRLYGYVDPGIVGTVVLTLGQLFYLPTFAAWAVSFAAGPGFTLGSGSSVAWGQTTSGPLPLIPVLGALPDPGPLPTWVMASVALPVLVGVFVGWRCVSACSRLASWGERSRSVAAGVVLTALGMSVVGALASGSLGSSRLGDIGVQPWLMGLALAGELAAGAVVSLLASALRGRHIRPVKNAA